MNIELVIAIAHRTISRRAIWISVVIVSNGLEGENRATRYLIVQTSEFLSYVQIILRVFCDRAIRRTVIVEIIAAPVADHCA